jgi:hypothetical protein
MIQADYKGRGRGRFFIPADTIREGARELDITGDQGTATKGLVFITDEANPEGRWILHQIAPDFQPLAQTFKLAESRMIGAIDLKFCSLGDYRTPVRIQIRETEVGIPTQVVLGEAVLYQPAINTGDWCRFYFSPPVPCLRDVEYSIVLLTTDKNYKVAVATQGQYVQAGNGPVEGWVTEQPYQIGVLLYSSNASTWTPMQKSDLTFRICGCVFDPVTKDVDLGNVVDAAVTDAVVKAIVQRPFGVADAKFEVDVDYDHKAGVAVDGEDAHTEIENIPLRLIDRLGGTFDTVAHLSGDAKVSPIVLPNAHLQLGNLEDTAEYITIPMAAAEAFSISLIFDGLRTGNSAIKAYVGVQNVDGGGHDVTSGGIYEWSWVQLVKQTKVVPLGNGWNEETWEMVGPLRGIGLDRTTRVKIRLEGGPNARPVVKNLRVVTVLNVVPPIPP